MASLFASRPRRVVSLASDVVLPSGNTVSGKIAVSRVVRLLLRRRALLALKALLLMGVVSVTAMAQTTTLVVTTVADSTDGSCSSTLCSLRDALNAAYGATGTTNIQFAAGVTGTITLGSTLPSFSGTTNIIGPGASLLTIDGGSSSAIGNIFTVGNSSVVTISGVTIANGNVPTGNGGGIVSYATLTVNNVAFTGNSAEYGGAISESTGTLTINNSTFSGNTAVGSSGLGGAIMNYTTTTINNSTFSGNSSANQAGVIINYGSAVVITNSTFAGDTATNGGDAIISYNPGLAVSNSFFADGGGECYGSTACPVTGTAGNVVPADASTLAPLGNYGGQTQTLIPLPGSTAICAATPSLATAAGLTTDQRSFPRTNTTYTGYNGSAPCVDAGAVQTHYTSVAFATQPSSTSVATAISPAPTVEVLETDSNLTAPANTNTVAGIPLALTLNGTGTLGGTATETTISGTLATSGLVSGSVASFGNLTVSADGSGDTLSTNLTITPAAAAGVTTLTTTSSPFDVAPAVSITVGTSPTGLGFTVDGTAFTATDTTSWVQGSQHALTTASPQTIGGVEYVFTAWSDGTTSLTDNVTVPTSVTGETYTATFAAAYPLTLAAGTGGVVSATSGGSTFISGGYLSSGAQVQLTAAAASGYTFAGWTVSGSATLSSATTPATTLIMGAGAATATANFQPTYVVNTLNDSTDGSCGSTCSLRDAITAANGAGSAANITFASGLSGTILLTSTLPAITGTVNITGSTSAAITISGGKSSTVGSIFTVNSGAVVNFSNLTIANGNAASNGGAILSYGTVTVNNSTLANNASSYGSAISTSGPLLTVNNTTFSGNAASSYGAIIIYAKTVLNNTTFVGNTGTDGFPAMADESGSSTGLTVNNSLFADGVTECYSSQPTCPASGTSGNVILANATTLAPLGNYGGPTQTFLPLPGSTAICAATATVATTAGLTTDQRGSPLAGGGYCPAGSIDAGSVQTDYSVSFTTQPGPIAPATSLYAGTSFQAAVTLDESGTVFVSPVTIPLILTGPGTLSNGSATTSNGVATYSTLQVSASGAADTLTANVALTSTATASAISDSFAVGGSIAAAQSIASETLTQNQPSATFTPVLGSGGTPPLTYSISPALPTGLAVSASTGTITGSPTTPIAATTFTVKITDSTSATASNTFSLTVDSAVTATQAVASTTLTSGHAATSFTPVTGAGGAGTLTYSVSPALPSGLTLSTSTGAITGTPTIASSITTYTVIVTDSNNATATATFSLTVAGPVAATQAIASKTLTVNQPSTSFTPVTGAGGSGTLTYSISATLPAGLSFSTSTGAITGTPTVTSTATTYTVTVTDSTSATATATFSLAVSSVVVATQAVPTETLIANIGSANFTPVTGSGGTAPLTYSITPALPAGLAVTASTGAVTGQATTGSAATTYTVTVTDLNGATASSTFSLLVYAEPLSLTLTNSGTASATLAAGASASFNFALAPTEGVYPGTVTLAVTELPPGATYTITTTSVSSTAGPQTIGVTIKTASATAKNETQPGGRTSTPMFFAMLLPLLAGFGLRRKLPRALTVLLFAFAGVLGMLALTGCGSGNSTALQPAQTYAVHLTATSGTVQQTATVDISTE